VLGYDQETGFGLVQTPRAHRIAGLVARQSSSQRSARSVVWRARAAGIHSVAAHIAARQEFAGYWEYVLDEAIFTAPAHPNGAAPRIGRRATHRHRSLQLERRARMHEHLNMIVPIDLLKPISTICSAWPRKSPRLVPAWTLCDRGQQRVVVVGCRTVDPRARPIRTGDVVLGGRREVKDLAGTVSAHLVARQCGVEVPMKNLSRWPHHRAASAVWGSQSLLEGPRLH